LTEGLERGDIARLDDELDAPLTRWEIEQDERIQQQLSAPVAWGELSDREKAWLQWREQQGGTSS
jgi:hypothetical protein